MAILLTQSYQIKVTSNRIISFDLSWFISYHNQLSFIIYHCHCHHLRNHIISRDGCITSTLKYMNLWTGRKMSLPKTSCCAFYVHSNALYWSKNSPRHCGGKGVHTSATLACGSPAFLRLFPKPAGGLPNLVATICHNEMKSSRHCRLHLKLQPTKLVESRTYKLEVSTWQRLYILALNDQTIHHEKKRATIQFTCRKHDAPLPNPNVKCRNAPRNFFHDGNLGLLLS